MVSTVCSVAVPTLFPIPSEIGLIAFLVGFFVAPALVFADMYQRLAELEAVEADIILEISQPPTIEPRAKRDDHGEYRDPTNIYGISADGMPSQAELAALLRIKNPGHKPGTLKWDIDRQRTYLPTPFRFVEGQRSQIGYSGPYNDLRRDGEVDYKDWWLLEIQIDPQLNAELMAKQLAELEYFKVTLRYYTERLLGRSQVRTLTVSGDFAGFRRIMFARWRELGLERLLAIHDDIRVRRKRILLRLAHAIEGRRR
ncbi:MAG: hypothetical protein HZB53_11085 [Chloroflexi bacterium]|nr:hypothetical protein [Chloroflexota bacterium]